MSRRTSSKDQGVKWIYVTSVVGICLVTNSVFSIARIAIISRTILRQANKIL